MKQIYTETQELLDAVLGFAGDELGKDEPSEDVVTHEIGRWLSERGWMSPTEAEAARRHLSDASRSMESARVLVSSRVEMPVAA